MKYIDLSYTISNDIEVSPFDNAPVLERVKFISSDTYNDTLLTSTMHIGTHIDAPSHFINNGKQISDYSIDKFIGRGVLLDYKHQPFIQLKESYKDRIIKGSIVLIQTGMDKLVGTKEYYYDHPIISEELCDYLIEKNVKVIGLDFFSPDQSPSIIHKKLLSSDILIVENLKDLELLEGVDEFIMNVIPMKIKAEGSFVRAFAEVVK